MRVNRSILLPENIQTLRPQQLAVVVNYYIHNGRHQTWIMCDDHPFHIFIIPERDTFPLQQITDTLDNHFDDIVFFPTQRQFIKSYKSKGIKNISAKFELDPEIKRSIAARVIGFLGKLIRIGNEIIKIAAKDVLLLAGFAGKQLIKLFLGIIAALVDCYEAIPMNEEARSKRAVANSLRDLNGNIELKSKISKLEGPSALEINRDAFNKIVSIIKDEVDEATEYKDDFMGELNKSIPLLPTDGVRRRL